ncbi:MAG: pilus assembly protein [Arenimonas sp.]
MHPSNKNKPVIRSPFLLAKAISFSLFATLCAAPSLAGIAIPNSPLQTGARVPPNILFILDDSGSMEETSFDNSVLGTFTGGGLTSAERTSMSLQTYANNTIYYNPNVSYEPWRTATWPDPSTGLLANTPYTAAHNDLYLASTAINLALSARDFYVPVGAAGTDAANYYRYRIATDGITINRCRRAQVAGTWAWRNNALGAANVCDVTDSAMLTWTNPSTGASFSRTPAQEIQNYATWYSFHRTRAKVAKAGASDAFSGVSADYRVGFSTIHSIPATAIPVTNDNGLFRGTNRSAWFTALHNETKTSGTPLRTALQNAGEYFKLTDSTGPYGPETEDASTPRNEQLSCRQNFSILTTDGYWNNTSATYNDAVGNADGTNGSTITGPLGINPTGRSYTYNASLGPYSDTNSNTLADVAMHYWKNDLRSDLTNRVLPSTENPAFWQHMVTFGVSIGLTGSITDQAAALPQLTQPGRTLDWPNPLLAEDNTRIDDLWHASLNGRGKFVAATNPTAFRQGLNDALAAIESLNGSSSNVSANSFSLNSNTRVYLASYVSGKWIGELAAYPITSAGVGATPAWSASSVIPVAASRNIKTWSGTTGVAFPTATQTTALTSDVADYIRGVTVNEARFKTPPIVAPVFRNRVTELGATNLLGDIVHSSPAYVEDTNTLYVGANDGMLHAFNGATGVEQFAYIPRGINLVDLKSLSNPGTPAYDHRYFVDGPVVVSTRAQTPGNNYLVGALGRGGKGLFGLNVTTPASFANNDVLWETTGGVDAAEMGQVISRPIIAKLNGNGNGVLVSNGVNSTNDHAALFIINLTTGAKIETLVPTLANGNGVNNGLSAARGWDADGNGTVDYVYAGDLLGNVWKFDLSSNNSNSWGVANGGAPIFVAKDSLGNRQPISGGITIGLEPNTFDTWIFFGTGRYLETGDPAISAVQSWYGLLDNGSTIADRTALKERKILALGTFAGKTVRGFERAVVGDMIGKRGWYIDLLTPPTAPSVTPIAAGERMIGDPSLSNGTLFASSIIPSSDPCDLGGTGFVNALFAFSGSSGYAGVPGSLDVNGNGNFTDDVVTYGTGTLPVGSVDLGIYMPTNPAIVSDLLVVGGSRGGTGTLKVNNPSNSGRISWREIIGD